MGPPADLDLMRVRGQILHKMKMITEEQRVERFGEFSQLAHDGQSILVTRGGQPWVVLSAPTNVPKAAAADTEQPMEWPDFEAHWRKHFPVPLSGPTATEILAEDKEDRF